MIRFLLLLLCSFISFSSFAVDKEFERLSRAESLAQKRLAISNTGLKSLKNEVERNKLKEQLDNGHSEIVGISSNTMFVKKSNTIIPLKVGDSYAKSTIKSFGSNFVLLKNGKKVYVY